MLLLDDETPVGATATVEPPGDVTSPSRPVRTANGCGGPCGPALEPTRIDRPHMTSTHCWRLTRAASTAPNCGSWFDERGIQFGPAFTGLTAARVAEGAVSTVLAEIGLPRSIRTQQAGYAMHPALLDACFQSVAAHPPFAVWIAGRATKACCCPLRVRRLRAYASTRNAQLLLHHGHGMRHQCVRGRHRRAGRARDRAAGGAGPAMGTGFSEAPTAIGCWVSGC